MMEYLFLKRVDTLKDHNFSSSTIRKWVAEFKTKTTDVKEDNDELVMTEGLSTFFMNVSRIIAMDELRLYNYKLETKEQSKK